MAPLFYCDYQGASNMIRRNATVINPPKARDFAKFIRETAKDKSYWNDVNKIASTEVDKNEVNMLCNEEHE